MLEYMLGIRLGANGTVISVKPNIAYTADIVLGQKKLKITVSDRYKTTRLNGGEVSFPVTLTDAVNDLEIPFGK